MEPLLAVHDKKGSFSDRWIEEIERRRLNLRIVDCYKNTILDDLKGCHALLWHWDHSRPKDWLVASHIIRAVETMGLKVFPDTASCWHFDDKIAQKYLLEAIGAPIAPTYIFLEMQEAIAWARKTTWPKVFKLRKGAGSRNVRLIKGSEEAIGLIRKAFGRGFRVYGSVLTDFSFKLQAARKTRGLFKSVLHFPKYMMDLYKNNKLAPREKGYVYFQDFIANNANDIRVTVIGKKAFAFIRRVRKGDFRASGSGMIDYFPSSINPECIRIAIEITQKMKGQSVAFDFILNEKGCPTILEVSYCYVDKAVYNCSGYWDDKLIWHEGHVWPEDAILDDLLDSLGHANSSRNSNV
jgi:glutathione synthase/RimK-type ligase-like ATP-grasp enzyme